MRMAELYINHRAVAVAKPEIVATYDYIDLHGVLDAQKVRYSNKRFRWRSPHPSESGR
jgi:hypothetical protein